MTHLRTQLCATITDATCALKACCSLAPRQRFWMVTAAAFCAASCLRCCHPLHAACMMPMATLEP